MLSGSEWFLLKILVHFHCVGTILSNIEIVLCINTHTTGILYPLLFRENNREESAVLIQQTNSFTVTVAHKDVTEDICTDSIGNKL